MAVSNVRSHYFSQKCWQFQNTNGHLWLSLSSTISLTAVCDVKMTFRRSQIRPLMAFNNNAFPWYINVTDFHMKKCIFLLVSVLCWKLAFYLSCKNLLHKREYFVLLKMVKMWNRKCWKTKLSNRKIYSAEI